MTSKKAGKEFDKDPDFFFTPRSSFLVQACDVESAENFLETFTIDKSKYPVREEIASASVAPGN